MLMQEMARGYSEHTIRPGQMAIGFQAGYHADHILTYLSTIVDDIAGLIILVMGCGHLKRGKNPIESMGDLKASDIRSKSHLAPVTSLLAELDGAGSWWERAFKTKAGARQLLIHNQHLVSFECEQSPGQPYETRALLISPFPATSMQSDYFRELREIFAGLFDWLDRLEAALIEHLRGTLVGWSPMRRSSSFNLPVGYPEGPTVYDSTYFPLPLCDGSDALPWTIGGSIVPHPQQV
jgi:hypothetical protein